MNTKKIFIDATRDNNYSIVILNKEGDLEECNFENQGKQTFKSNIYLAKIIRVEHSLQAAFVEYAEDKVGFLPFSEINPDYYQIPVFDKEKIQQSLKEEAEKNMAMGENYVETLSENGDNSENEDFRKN